MDAWYHCRVLRHVAAPHFTNTIFPSTASAVITSPSREHPGVRQQLTRGDAQERGLAAAVSSHEPDALTFFHRHGGAIQHGVRTVADGEFGGAGDGIGHERGANIHAPRRRGKLESG